MNNELTDAQWALILPHLPPPKKRGRPRAQDRRTINGILYVLLKWGSRSRSAPSWQMKQADARGGASGVPIGGLVASAQQKEVVADKGYDSGPLRRRLRRRGIKPCIPECRGKKPVLGRKAELFGYRRWKVERSFAWLANFRRLVVRYE